MKYTCLFVQRFLFSFLMLLSVSGVYAQDSYTAQRAFPAPGREAGIAFSIGAKAYVGMGWIITSYYNDFWEWDQATNTWTQKTSFPTAGREGMVSFAIGTKGYAGMGQGTGAVYNRDLYEYDPATNAWTAKASLASGNERSYAVSFVMGGLGYVGTGENGSAYRKDFWKYNPATNTWAAGVDMPGFTYRGYAMTFTIGSKAFVAGGTDNVTLFKDLWEFNGTTWTARADMPVARHSGIGFTVCNTGYVGTGVVASSTISKDMWAYNGDPASTGYNTWNKRNDIPAESHLSSTFQIGNDAYIAIGHSTDFLQTLWKYNPFKFLVHYPLNSVYVTDAPVVLSGGIPAGGTYTGTGVTNNIFYPATAGAGLFTITYTFGCLSTTRTIRVMACTSQSGNTWTAKLSYPGSTVLRESGFSIGSKGYLITGQNSSSATTNVFWSWDQAANTWTQLSNFPGTDRHNAVAFSIGTKAYFGTGYSQSTTKYLNDFWEWDQPTNTWTQRNDFPGNVREHAVGFAIGSKGYVGTGKGALNTDVYNDFYEWEPIAGTWTRKTDVPGGIRFSAVGFSIGTKGYVGTGLIDPSNLSGGYSDFWEWDQLTNSWLRKTDVPGGGATGRYNAISFALGAKGYVGSGALGGTGVFTFYEWDQASNTWTSRTNVPTSGKATFAINGKGYLKGNPTAFYEYGPLTCASSVVTNSLSGINFCAGNAVVIPYSALGTFGAANVFTAELSNSSGSFASPVNLGQVTSTTSGSISVTIPAGTAYGTGYRIRVNASLAPTSTVTGTDNGANLTIFASTSVTLTSFSAVYESTAPFALTGGLPAGGTYSGSGVTSNTFDPSSVGPGTYTITYSNGCSSAQKTITVIGCADGSWTAKANYPGATIGSEASFSIGNKGYVLTGLNAFSYTKYFWSWDQTTNAWTQLTDFPGSGRQQAVAFAIGTKGYIGTGYSEAYVPLNDFWEWDQATNTWLQKANFPGVARFSAVGFSIGTKGYIGTGVSVGTFLNDFYEWDQSSNTWSRKADLPTAGRRVALSFVLGSNAYVGGGISNETIMYKNDFWEWNQATNAWTRKSDLPGDLKDNMFGIAISSKGYVGGGTYPNSTTNSFDFWQWNNLTDTWIAKAAIPIGTDGRMPVFTINGKGYKKGSYTAFYEYVPDCQPLGIAVNDISSLTFCLGGPSTSVAYTALGTFTSGNVFTAQLSNPSGSFASPINVGTVTSTTSGSINITLPANLPAGANYRLRVVSSTPVVTGISNTSALVINPTVTFGTLNTVYSTDAAFALTQGSPSGGTYSGTGVSNGMFNPATAGVGTFTITYTYGCKSVTRTIQVVGCTYNEWRQKANYPGASLMEDGTFSINNKGYVFAGRASDGSPTNGFWSWDQPSNTWTQLANTPSEFYFGGLTAFAIGAKGYVYAAYNDVGITLNHFWEWDLATNIWSRKTDYPGTAAPGAAAFVIGTKGYIVTGDLNSSLWEWEQASDVWTKKADFPGVTRRYAAAFSLNNNGYVAAGGTTEDFWQWNQSLNQWQQKANLPWVNETAPYSFVLNGRIFVGAASAYGSPPFRIDEWNPSTNTWTFKSNTPVGGGFRAPYFVINGRGYYKGNGPDFYEYYPSCDPIISVNDLTGLSFCNNGATLTIPYTASGAFYSDNIFTAQLSNASGSFASPINIGTVGASTSGLISITIPSGTPAGSGYRIRVNSSAPAVTGLDNGVNIIIPAAVTTSITTTYPAMRIDDPYIVLTGGTPSGGVYSGDGVANGTFDPALAGPGIHTITYTNPCSVPATTFIEVKACSENVWTKRQDALDATGTGTYAGAASFSIGGYAYVLSGALTGINTNTFWSWEQSSNTWTQKANFGGTARGNAVAFAIGTKGYIGTGNSGSTYFNDLWEWNQVTNSWSQKSNFGGSARSGGVAFSIGNKGYISLGRNASTLFTDLWEWNQSSNAWVQRSNFPGLGRSYAYACSLNGKAYIGCGEPGTMYDGYKDHWEWDPTSNNWSQKADVPSRNTSRNLGSAFAFALNSKIVVGGTGIMNGDPWYYIWDPTSDSWTDYTRIIYSVGGSGDHYFTPNGFTSGIVINGRGYARESTVGFNEYGCPSTLHVNDLAQKNICTGTTVAFSFSQLGGPLNTSNQYYIEFSDPDGVFRSTPYYTSTSFSANTLSSPLSYTIPTYLGTTDNAVYRIRLRSTSPYLVSEASSFLINIKWTHPGVHLDPFSSVTTATLPFALTGGTPEGGVYSGPGVSNGIFDPSAAGVGTHTITYTYNSCSTPATNTIAVTCSGCDVARPSGGDIAEVKFYPNPFSDKVKVFVNEVDNGSTPAVVHLMNLQGEEVHREEIMTNEEKEFTVNIPSGMYMINITVNDKVVGRYKLMKGN